MSAKRVKLPAPERPKMLFGSWVAEDPDLGFLAFFGLVLMPFAVGVFPLVILAQFISVGASLGLCSLAYLAWVGTWINRYFVGRKLANWSYPEEYFKTCWYSLSEGMRGNMLDDYEGMVHAARNFKSIPDTNYHYKMMVQVILHAERKYAQEQAWNEPLGLKYIEEANRIQNEVIKETQDV